MVFNGSDEVPWCANITVSGAEVPGSALWLAYHDQNNREFQYRKMRYDQGEEWNSPLRLGRIENVGTTYEVFIFYLPERVSSFLEDMNARISVQDVPKDISTTTVSSVVQAISAYPYGKQLPPERSNEVRRVYTRTDDLGLPDC
ncbi:hypothetical protein EEB14_20765 [Rhodococcus sp. WS4]|nr:hypothetical protein EEB14_20765 [Rhodococcus sp. WS4]